MILGTAMHKGPHERADARRSTHPAMGPEATRQAPIAPVGTWEV